MDLDLDFDFDEEPLLDADGIGEADACELGNVPGGMESEPWIGGRPASGERLELRCLA